MKSSTAPNRRMGRMITKNLIILLVLVIVAVLSIWAWFTSRTTATADGISVVCNAPDSVEIAIVGHGANEPKSTDYKTGNITLSGQSFMKNLALSEITSDGVDFVKPMLKQVDGVAQPDTEVDWETAESNERYLSFDLYLRSKGTPTVSLDKGSRFTTVSTSLTGPDAGNISTDNNFSRDAIVGAARFSIFENVVNEGVTSAVRKILWIPRPDLYLSTAGGASLTENVSKDKFDGVTYQHTYWNYDRTNNIKEKVTMPDSDVTTSEEVNGEYVLNTKKQIATLSNSKKFDDGVYFVSKVVCNMWIEGEDAEARLALVKGKFNIDLKLTIK